MGKKKKKLNDFKEAMLSNTKFIGKDDENDVIVQKSNENPRVSISIDHKLFFQFKILAKYQGDDANALVEQALTHYLRLKSIKLEKAMKEMTEDDNET